MSRAAAGPAPRLALLALAALAAAPAAGAHRSVEVPAPGWVRVPLDAAAVAALGAGGPVVVDPEGRELSARRLAAGPEADLRPARIAAVAPEPGGGHRLLFDLGPDRRRHERLLLELDGWTLAPGCRLEASEDGARFAPLAEADLFHLGDGEGLAHGELRYPASEARFLSLHWPAAAGAPRLRRARVGGTAGRPAPLLLPAVAEPAAAPGGIERRLLVPPGAGAAVRGLGLRGAASGPLAYRLFAAESGRWRQVASGRLPDGAAPASIPVPPGLPRGPRLRLDLPAGAGAGELAWELEPAALLFRARRAGTHVVDLGDDAPAADEAGPAPGEPVAEVALGPPAAEGAAPDRTAPAAGAAPGAELPAAAFAHRFRLEGGSPGAAAAWELPGELAAALRDDLGDLRLAVGGRQWPYLLRPLEEPARWHARPLAPGPLPGETGASGAGLALPAPGWRWSQVEVTAPPRGFARPLRLLARAHDAPPGTPPRELARGPWRCDGGPLPCLWAHPLGGRAAQELAWRFDDGDEAPLAGLEVEVWRLRHELRFVWPPAGMAVELVAGAAEVAPPRYDLASASAELLAADALPVRATELAAGGAGRWQRPLLLAALGLAGALLLALLARQLRGPSPPVA